MLVVVGGLVLVGFGVASIFSPDLFGSIGDGLKAVGTFLGQAVSYILWPFIYVISWIIRGIIGLLRLLGGRQEPGEGELGGMPEIKWPEVVPKELPFWATETIKWVLVALLVGLVLFILAKAVSRLRGRRAGDGIEEIHESLFSWKGLRDDLKELLGMLGNRFKRGPAGTAFDENAAGRMDVREIYRHVLWEGTRSGLPRRIYETPSDFYQRVGTSVPESRDTLEDITREYENVRYGEMSLSEERVDRVNSLWRKLRETLRRLRGD
jgi:hypothetical protein